MRKWLLVLAITSQVGVLAYMAGGRELILKTGDSIVVRTAPIDPRDPFRGDFVRLQYPFNSPRNNSLAGKLGTAPLNRGDPIYAVLKPSPGGLHQLDFLTDERPGQLPFLAGYVASGSYRKNRPHLLRNTRFRYGIEQLFVEQGDGLAIEKRRGRRNTTQVPMEVELAVASSGKAIIKGFRWSRLGIRSEVIQSARRARTGSGQSPGEPARRSALIRLTLSNESDQPLSIFDLTDGCALQLVATEISAANTARFDLLDNSCPTSPGMPGPESGIFQLQAGASHAVEIDLSKPRWHVVRTDNDGVTTQGEIGVIAPRQTFRLIYQADQTAQTRSADMWIGEMPSRLLRATGFID
ncbi:MAG: GDYXXLXY domain-containing protein [Burkholderiaceae bacterium]